MTFHENEVSSGGENGGSFTVTHWSMVLLASQDGSPQAEAALATLCHKYWYPLYFYARRLGHSPEDAQDLVQGFFARVLEKNYLKDADRSKGRFRSFLLMALRRFMANEWDRANRLKRGGGREFLSMDGPQAEMCYSVEQADSMSPEKAYDRKWAVSLLGKVLDRLEQEFEASGKAEVFKVLKTLLTGERSDLSYAQLGQELGLTEGNLKVTVHRFRQRYGELLRLEIAQTVETPESVEEELRHLFSALS